MKRLLFPLCILMAVLIVAIGMTTVSFSWFEPNKKEGIGLEFLETTTLRDENCSISTYSGTYNNTPGTTGYGLVQYGASAISNTNVTVSEGKTAYFKTVITNSSKDYDTVVSLYLPSFSASSTNIASIGVAYPTNSYRTFSSAQTDIHIIRNAQVIKHIETDANPGQLSVEWFVKCDKGSITFNPSSVYLMYS
ncbi:MAG: hypothetical protein E7513_01695 [Ruminococcaceae bacterium]|nr:hypothetical protein [Oscillospiraceae bacterium]